MRTSAWNPCIISALGIGVGKEVVVRSVMALVLGIALAAAATGSAGERAVSTLQPASPCGFFRDQAWGKGIGHFAMEMLWACEAIAVRRGAGMPLGARLEAAEVALVRYRDGFVAGVSPGSEPDLARASGALDALAAINGGF
jgi:hypothetical protein